MSMLRRTVACSGRQRVKMAAVHAARCLEAVVYMATLSLVTLDLSAPILFSDWLEDYPE